LCVDRRRRWSQTVYVKHFQKVKNMQENMQNTFEYTFELRNVYSIPNLDGGKSAIVEKYLKNEQLKSTSKGSCVSGQCPHNSHNPREEFNTVKLKVSLIDRSVKEGISLYRVENGTSPYYIYYWDDYNNLDREDWIRYGNSTSITFFDRLKDARAHFKEKIRSIEKAINL
jgi:hypothetical protein